MSSQATSQKTLRDSSRVLQTPPADPKTAENHFVSRLSFETDPSDVYSDIMNNVSGIVVVDARTLESYARGHIPGAINLPHREINSMTTSALPKDKLYVTYCDGVFCNASTRAAAKLAGLGFHVKEMLDGMDGRKKEGYPVEETVMKLAKKNDA